MNTTFENNNSTDAPSVITQDNSPQTEKPASAPPAHNIAVQNIVAGALWCVGGIIVTATTYNAVKDTGGTYFVAWGAILFGGIQFLKGLCQLGD